MNRVVRNAKKLKMEVQSKTNNKIIKFKLFVEKKLQGSFVLRLSTVPYRQLITNGKIFFH